MLVNSETLGEGWLEGEEGPCFCSCIWPLDLLYHKATPVILTLLNFHGAMGALPTERQPHGINQRTCLE